MSRCQELILKQGRVKLAHFAHLPYSECTYAGEPESQQHINTKLEIYEALKSEPGVSKLQVERYLKEVRPDMSFSFENRYIAIEVQISPLSLDELIRRTTAYTQKNIYVLWTPILPMDMFSERYAPKEWEQNIHDLYDGTVYYWSKCCLNQFSSHFQIIYFSVNCTEVLWRLVCDNLILNGPAS